MSGKEKTNDDRAANPGNFCLSHPHRYGFFTAKSRHAGIGYISYGFVFLSNL